MFFASSVETTAFATSVLIASPNEFPKIKGVRNNMFTGKAFKYGNQVIIYRNSTNIGFPIKELTQAIESIQVGDKGSENISSGEKRNMVPRQVQVYHQAAFPLFINNIIKAARLFNFKKAKEVNYE